MKVYVLLSHVDYEGSDVLAVYSDPTTAEAWRQWCEASSAALRYGEWGPDSSFQREWASRFKAFPGDGYSVEEHAMRDEAPPAVVLPEGAAS